MATNISKAQHDLLATFVDGPRIWDAATLFKTVCDLETAGYVTFIGDGPKAEITDAGRTALADEARHDLHRRGVADGSIPSIPIAVQHATKRTPST